jgi:hypothetical protein
MFAIGELLVYVLQGGLILLTLLGIRRWHRADSSRKKVLAMAQVFLASGLLIRGFYLQKKEENEYIGTYLLTDYPECPTCVLYLQPANHYEVRQGRYVKEQGPWHFESGSDYWAVEIGEGGQLGSGRFNYDYDVRKKTNQKPIK